MNNEDDLNLYNCILKYQNLLQKCIISRFQSNFILPEIFHLNKKTGNPIFCFHLHKEFIEKDYDGCFDTLIGKEISTVLKINLLKLINYKTLKNEDRFIAKINCVPLDCNI